MSERETQDCEKAQLPETKLSLLRLQAPPYESIEALGAVATRNRSRIGAALFDQGVHRFLWPRGASKLRPGSLLGLRSEFLRHPTHPFSIWVSCH